MSSEPHDHPSDAVIAGFDGSAASVAAVQWAADQADRTGARLDVVTAWEYPTSWGSTIPLPNDYDPVADARHLMDPVLEQLRNDHPSLDIHPHVIEGHPGEVLVEASHHGNLLVVASRGHRALTGVMLGSVSLHCATNADCPVVVFRQPKSEI